MENNKQILCRLCHCVICDEPFEIIDTITKQILEIVLLKLDLNEKDEVVLCKVCSTKLLAAFKFKTTCVDTETTVACHLNFDWLEPIDLMEIYVKARGPQQSIILDNQKVCRFCLELVIDKYAPLGEVEEKLIQTFIPEMNLQATRDPVICENCLQLLSNHTSFIKRCSALENIKKEREDNIEETHGHSSEKEIKQEEVDMEPQINQNVDIKPEIKQEEVDLKPEEDAEENKRESIPDLKSTNDNTWAASDSVPSNYSQLLNGSVSSVKCRVWDEHSYAILNGISALKLPKVEVKDCDDNPSVSIHNDDTSNKKTNITVKEIILKCDNCPRQKMVMDGSIADLSSIETYRCVACLFKTKYEHIFNGRKLQHVDPYDLKVYKCEECGFHTCRKTHFHRHEAKHAASHKRGIFKCKKRPFNTWIQGNFQVHKLKHTVPSAVETYNYDQCSYQTLMKHNLNIHRLGHSDLSEANVYKSEICPYQTLSESNLNKRAAVPKSRLLTCEDCSYVTKCKLQFRAHLLQHDVKKSMNYKCNECPYQTLAKYNLKMHKLKHADPSKLDIYKCEDCTYQTKFECAFNAHKSKHVAAGKGDGYSYQAIFEKYLTEHKCYKCASKRNGRKTKKQQLLSLGMSSTRSVHVS